MRLRSLRKPALPRVPWRRALSRRRTAASLYCKRGSEDHCWRFLAYPFSLSPDFTESVNGSETAHVNNLSTTLLDRSRLVC